MAAYPAGRPRAPARCACATLAGVIRSGLPQRLLFAASNRGVTPSSRVRPGRAGRVPRDESCDRRGGCSRAAPPPAIVHSNAIHASGRGLNCFAGRYGAVRPHAMMRPVFSCALIARLRPLMPRRLRIGSRAAIWVRLLSPCEGWRISATSPRTADIRRRHRLRGASPSVRPRDW